MYLEDVTTATAIDLGSCVLSGEPYNINVDWCDGSEVEHYEETTGQPTIKHTYSTAGNQQIKITGNLGWYGNWGGSYLKPYLVGIEVKNSSPLTRVSDSAFYYYQKLRTIDGKMFENCVSQTTFNYTFHYCSKLTSIPEGLFDKNTEVTSFVITFASCSNLTNIPAGLFDNNTKVTSFYDTFNNTPNLTIHCYNEASQPSYGLYFLSNTAALKEIYLWNVIPSKRDLDAFIDLLPTTTATLYLGVSKGFESTARTELTETQEEALTAKGWSFGGVVR